MVILESSILFAQLTLSETHRQNLSNEYLMRRLPDELLMSTTTYISTKK